MTRRKNTSPSKRIKKMKRDGNLSARNAVWKSNSGRNGLVNRNRIEDKTRDLINRECQRLANLSHSSLGKNMIAKLRQEERLKYRHLSLLNLGKRLKRKPSPREDLRSVSRNRWHLHRSTKVKLKQTEGLNPVNNSLQVQEKNKAAKKRQAGDHLPYLILSIRQENSKKDEKIDLTKNPRTKSTPISLKLEIRGMSKELRSRLPLHNHATHSRAPLRVDESAQ